MRDPASSPSLAAGLVFVASAAVLVVEILGIRLLAPYVGLTLETTTAIIGTVLAGIAAGSALGGRAADRVSPRLLLPVLLAAGGALAIATVPLVRLFGSALRGGGDAAALVIALTALLPPATALSAVTPAVVKLQLRDLGVTGSVVGRLSAWATTGGLVGTFATGFVIVPLLATDVALYALGAGLIVLALALGRGGAPWSGSVLGLIAGAAVLGGVAVAVGAPCDAETRYHCARVDVDPQRPSGRTLVLENLKHSYVDLDDPRAAGARLRPLDRRCDRRHGAARRAARRRLPRRRGLHAPALPAGDAPRLPRPRARGGRRAGRARARAPRARGRDATSGSSRATRG